MHILQAQATSGRCRYGWGKRASRATEIYLRADPTEKLDALAMGIPPALKRGKFPVPDKLMAMFNVGKPV